MRMPVLSRNASSLKSTTSPPDWSPIALATRSPSSAAFDRSISPKRCATGSPEIDSSSRSARGITLPTPQLSRMWSRAAFRNPEDEQDDVVARLGLDDAQNRLPYPAGDLGRAPAGARLEGRH